MKVRHLTLAFGVFVLAGCSWLPHFGKQRAPVQQMLMKSLAGEVDYDLGHSLPADAYAEVTLSDVSKQGDSARVIASERISPLGSSPVPFVLSYEPESLGRGTDFAVAARIKQGDRTLATTETPVHVLGSTGNSGPVRIVVTVLH